MRSSYNPLTGDWEIAWPGRVSRHDLVYGSPPADPMQGIPLGNGDVGALAWCEGSRLILAVNRSDLWDDEARGRFTNWKAEEEEHSTTLRHAGRLVVDLGLPVLDIRYLSGFEARLSLADASMSLRASGPFGTVSCEAFVDWQEGLIWLEAETSLLEDVPLVVRVERYGSRTFSHWYSLVNRDASLGLSGTEAHADTGIAGITHRLSTGTFGFGCRLAESAGLSVAVRREHSHAAVLEVTGGRQKRITVVAGVTSPGASSAADRLRTMLSAGVSRGRQAAFSAHRESWKGFWMRSLMEYGDDYLDNLWHLTMYYACASQRGSCPARFINGLWSWSGDNQPWNFYFHWNQQQVYWPLNAAGHHDLVESYLRYRFDSLPHAREDARQLFHAEGAFVSDVAERRGYNSASESANHTPVAEIALDFWRQYRYTGDRELLKERVLPYLREAAAFLESLFVEDADGRLHAREGTGYEGWIRLRDPVTELVYGRAVFAAALQAVEASGVAEPRARRWRETLDRLAPLPVIDAPASCIQAGPGGATFARGFFKGDAAPTGRLLAAGWGIEEKRYLTSRRPTEAAPEGGPSATDPGDPFELLQLMEQNTTPYSRIRQDMSFHDGIFPTVEACAVFPSGLVGLSDKGSDLFDTVVSTLKLYAPDCMGWDPLPIALARLGLGRETASILARWPRRWQYYCNGFGHYGPRDVFKADASLRFRTALVRDASAPDAKLLFPAWPFRHMGMESMSVLATAMNETLLQSHDGIIRVAPACHEHQSARFTLHATGGFVVSSEIREGRPAWVSIRCTRGGELRLEDPWTRRVIQRETSPGELLLFAEEDGALEGWSTIQESPARNASFKKDTTGFAMLGLPRMF